MCRKIIETGRNPTFEDFSEEFIYFVDKKNIFDYPKEIIRYQLRDGYDDWLGKNKAKFDSLNDFVSFVKALKGIGCSYTKVAGKSGTGKSDFFVEKNRDPILQKGETEKFENVFGINKSTRNHYNRKHTLQNLREEFIWFADK